LIKEVKENWDDAEDVQNNLEVKHDKKDTNKNDFINGSSKMGAIEERVLSLEKEFAQIQGWQKAAKPLGLVIGIIILAWLGVTSFVSIPEAAKKWIDNTGINKTAENIEDLEDDAKRILERIKSEQKELRNIMGHYKGKVLQVVSLPLKKDYTSDKIDGYSNDLEKITIKPRNLSSKLLVSATGIVRMECLESGIYSYATFIRIKSGDLYVAGTAFYLPFNKNGKSVLPFHIEGEIVCNSTNEVHFGIQIFQPSGTTASIKNMADSTMFQFSGLFKVVEVSQ